MKMLIPHSIGFVSAAPIEQKSYIKIGTQDTSVHKIKAFKKDVIDSTFFKFKKSKPVSFE